MTTTNITVDTQDAFDTAKRIEHRLIDFNINHKVYPSAFFIAQVITRVYDEYAGAPATPYVNKRHTDGAVLTRNDGQHLLIEVTTNLLEHVELCTVTVYDDNVDNPILVRTCTPDAPSSHVSFVTKFARFWIQDATNEAGLPKEDVAYVNAHSY